MFLGVHSSVLSTVYLETAVVALVKPGIWVNMNCAGRFIEMCMNDFAMHLYLHLRPYVRVLLPVANIAAHNLPLPNHTRFDPTPLHKGGALFSVKLFGSGDQRYLFRC